MSTYEGCADILFGASDLLPYDSDSYVRRNPLIYPLCRSWFTSLSFELCLMINVLVFSFKSLSKSRFWVLTLLICGHGALMLCLSKCGKTKPKRNGLVWKGSPKSSTWVTSLLICVPGVPRLYLSKCDKRQHT